MSNISRIASVALTDETTYNLLVRPPGIPTRVYRLRLMSPDLVEGVQERLGSGFNEDWIGVWGLEGFSTLKWRLSCFNLKMHMKA